MENLEKIIAICKVLDDNKAENIICIDTKNNSNVVDFFVLATGGSVVHIKSLADVCYDKMCELNIFDVVNRESFNLSKWQVVDLGEGFVHIFTKEEREKYNIEKLLGENGNVYTYYKLLKKQESLEDKRKKLEAKSKTKKEVLDKRQENKIINTKKVDDVKKKRIDKELYKIDKVKRKKGV